MTQQEIELYISSMINQSLAGQDIEHPKLEFKSQWYDLKDEKTKASFIKDTTAMANTVGLDGFIVIGYDESKQQFMPVQFSDCGFQDTSELPDKINTQVDR
ncbi:MAG: RNA-binding domain-containing protein, partial [Pseudobacter sp.]|uniref:RNA-binding domain-containing protein n=1 Tax=Pseudobacter sp. TaxID=2045420 RepID=UPI003F7F80EE